MFELQFDTMFLHNLRYIIFIGNIPPRHQYYRTHDQIGMINPATGMQAQAAMANLPVPVNMYMNPTIPPNYYQNGQMQSGKLSCLFCNLYI